MSLFKKIFGQGKNKITNGVDALDESNPDSIKKEQKIINVRINLNKGRNLSYKFHRSVENTINEFFGDNVEVKDSHQATSKNIILKLGVEDFTENMKERLIKAMKKEFGKSATVNTTDPTK